MPYLEYHKGDQIRDVKVESRTEGGFGVVYFGCSRLRGIHVAIKTFNPRVWQEYRLADVWARLGRNLEENDFSKITALNQGDYLMASFFREARLVCQANHPNLLRGLAFWHSSEGQPFLETEYSPGCFSIGDWIRDARSGVRARPSWLQVVNLAISACNGLLYASRELVRDANLSQRVVDGPKAIGFVHRDIKPDNLVYYPRGLLKIIDFGSGRFQLEKQSGPTLLTGRNITAYTPPYAPPEQLQAFGNVGPSCDVYALAMTMYEMLGGNTDAIEQDTAPRKYVPVRGVPAPLNEILAKCLDFDRWERFQDFAALKSALTSLINETRKGAVGLGEGRYCVGCGFIPAGVPAARPAAPASGPADLNGHEFARIPGGPFRKGCPPQAVSKFRDTLDLNDEDCEEVQVPEFYISKCTVTNEQYRRFVEATGHKPPEHWVGSGQPFPPADARKPVVRVSYEDAEAYCKWLGLRLPTGLEWEKAARGENSLLYPWGNEYRKGMCNSAEMGKGSVVPVDDFPEGDSPYGCRQMVGNVFEWVNEPHPDDPNFRYLRGGAWCVSCQYLGLPFLHYIAIARNSSKLSSPNPADTFGFRVAITNLPQPKSVAASFHDSHRGGASKDPPCPLCAGKEYADFAAEDLRQPDRNPYTWIGYFDIG